MDPAIEMRDVLVFRWSLELRRRTYLLTDFDWRVQGGEQWVVLGPNGAGKSTLMQIAAAVEQPTSGSVKVLGREFGATDLRELRKRIGFVDTTVASALRPGLNGREIVLTGAQGTIFFDPKKVTAEAERRADEFLALVGMERVADRRFGYCSQGERQRLLIARALMMDPEMLLLDEPGAGLDLPSREGLVKALVTLAETRPELTTVVVTHHLEEIPPSCTHTLLLSQGRSVAQGPIGETLTSESATACYGIPVAVERRDGRWSARGV